MTEAYIAKIPMPARLGHYAVHQSVYRVLNGRPLYRHFGDSVLAVSEEIPGSSVDYKPYAPKLFADDQLRFSLKADVSKSKSIKGKRGTRYDPILEAKSTSENLSYSQIAKEYGREWIENKSNECGFRVVEISKSDYEQIRFVRPNDQRQIRLTAIEFDGILEVTDVDQFRRSLVKGVGRGKAFGLGLLLIKHL